jgi:hypothetical protein
MGFWGWVLLMTLVWAVMAGLTLIWNYGAHMNDPEGEE